MPVSIPGPSFALSRWSSPDDSDDGWAAWQARIDAGLIGEPMDPAVAAAIEANEAVLLGRPARAAGRRQG